MKLIIPSEIYKEIQLHGCQAYPEEGAGLLLGQSKGADKEVVSILKLPNAREEDARHNRYLLTPQDYARGEMEADRLGLEVIGIFHSHPDHPDRPSDFDREWAMPWFSYVITSINQGQAAGSRSWILDENREQFLEEPMEIIKNQNQ